MLMNRDLGRKVLPGQEGRTRHGVELREEKKNICPVHLERDDIFPWLCIFCCMFSTLGTTAKRRVLREVMRILEVLEQVWYVVY